MVFLWEHSVYIWKGFKSHIEKILCYPFKLKYLNQKVFIPHWKNMVFFHSWKHRVYILMSFKSHIWGKKKKTGSRPGLPGSPGFGPAVGIAGLLLNPDRSSHRVDRVPGHPPGRTGFNNCGFTLQAWGVRIYWRGKFWFLCIFLFFKKLKNNYFLLPLFILEQKHIFINYL